MVAFWFCVRLALLLHQDKLCALNILSFGPCNYASFNFRFSLDVLF